MLKIIFLMFLTILISNTGYTQSGSYDSAYAKSLGADDYGMKEYVMAFLKSGKVKPENNEKANELQMAHLRNIMRMAEEGSLILAGPFSDNGEIRGIYIFNVKTIEEAKKLTETDPAVQAGVLEMELHPWYGSAALMEINKLHKTIQKTSIID